MIAQLKRKFVLINMLMVTAVLAVVFFSLYASSRANIQSSSMAVLQRVIVMDSSPSRPGDKPEEIQLPFFTVRIFSGSVYLANDSYYNFESTQEVADIVNACLKQGTSTGVLRDYKLRYLREDNIFETKIAFVDLSMEENTLRSLLISTLQIALAAFLLLLGLSVVLARWAVRPVERSLKQQHQFLSDASHELKTPLTVILSNVSLLQEELTDGSESEKRWLDNVDSESRRMKTLVEEMLTLARSDNPQRIKTPLAPVAFSDLVTDSALLFEPLAFESGKPLKEEIEADITVSGHTEQLRQVLAILLDNAIKYGLDGQEISLSLRREGKRALLQVANASAPISPERLRHLFDRFYRADDSRGETSGFGLGLAIAQTLLRDQGGTIRADTAGDTLRFTVTLPCLDGAAREAGPGLPDVSPQR